MAIKLQGTNSVAAPGLTNDGGDGVVVGTDSVDISIGGASKVKIDSSGRVGLGTTSVAKNDHSVLNVHSGTAGVYQYFTDSATGTGGDDGLTLGLDTSQNGMIWHRENKDIRIGTNANERLRVLAGGGLTFNGDTAAANALDDYEEGSFTPTITGYSAGSTQTYAHQAGNYTKIGNMVYAVFDVKLSAKGDIAGNYTFIQGFPFSNLSSRGGSVVMHYWHSLQNGASYMSSEFGGSVTNGCWVTWIPSAGSTQISYLNTSELGSSTQLYGTAIYRIS